MTDWQSEARLARGDAGDHHAAANSVAAKDGLESVASAIHALSAEVAELRRAVMLAAEPIAELVGALAAAKKGRE